MGLAGLPADSASLFPSSAPRGTSAVQVSPSPWLVTYKAVPEQRAPVCVQESDSGGAECTTALAASAGTRWPCLLLALGDALAQESSPGADRI